MRNYLKINGLLLFLLLPGAVSAQWNSFIINHKKDRFGHGAQTWQIRPYGDDHIFCANKNGILQYNGADWKFYPVQNGLDVRSVYVSERQGRVYAGGENEFGYLEADKSGELTYTSLSSEFNERYRFYGGYWGVFELDNMFYYVSDRHIVKQIGDTFTAVRSDFKIDCSAVINGILYVGTFNGIWMLVGNTWIPAQGSDSVGNKSIRAIVPYKDGFLAATAFDGLFYGTTEGVAPFVTGAEEFMRRNEVFSLAVSDTYIAVGTIHKGLLLIGDTDTETKSFSYYNEQNGLQNNTVLTVSFDRSGDLWLGLDNGIDYISLHNSLTNLYNSPYSKGAGYAAIIHSDRLYLGTNRGLYHTSHPVLMGEDAINPGLIAELSGQVWGLEKVGDDILCLHDKGLFLIRGTSVEAIPPFRGALICSPLENEPERCWIGSYDGLFMIGKKNGKWTVISRVEGVSSWMKSVFFESDYTVWIRDIHNGMTRVEIDPATFRTKENTQTFDETNGFESISELYAHYVFGEIRFSTLSGIYRYDPKTAQIVSDEVLNTFLLPGKNYTRIATIDSTLFALSPDMIQVVRFSSGTPVQCLRFPFTASHIGFIKEYEALLPIREDIAIIPNEQGFALLNTALPVKQERNALFIQNAYISYPKDSMIYTDNIGNRIAAAEIPYARNSLRFEYNIRSFGQTGEAKYRYRLLPDELWSEPSAATVKEYGNLREGDYVFEVEVIQLPNGDSAARKYAFTILPPWYRSVSAQIVYSLLLLASFYFLYRLDDRRIARKRKSALAQKDREMFLREEEYEKERLRKEQQIITLQNEKLEQELTFKSQEMANLMIHFSRKNEILLSIKQELSRITGEMKGEQFVKAKRMLLSLNGSIDSNIESDDALKRFEEQFNLVHNNFMKKVRERHPDLTGGEIKMCAYVKMGLSSKEIAPLLNISVRGVETLRYRLRKKMELEREDSLTEYLNSF
ncbi:MAG: transcriptional regulator [Tannerellaceae bacterium]|jgi:DNA-binding CsgD family transcriptional regulator|nr:transcriptional regulator [Tannerellaceae bacterium]